ncbi:hypothetical protein BJ138DRAFT_1181034 [Hygrophoropsis aurantiaca]|uniref:Uncharacterized protein n=1 Tax=Hygrophoropsis aurantiaca TaxID=72124 RepID=A0ACB8A7I4_9AGAM|nr:hypothetical protein BJ138DRAFT_1181034 [Hygrophoropsis aurantiaca]
MAFEDEHADILGGPILQTPTRGFLHQWSELSVFFQGSLLVGLGLVLWLISIRAREEFQKWREFSYRKATRRKYGIPDADCRPFAVAYAAATRAHAEREAREKSKQQPTTDKPLASGQHNALQDAQDIRNRFSNSVAVSNRRSPVKSSLVNHHQKHTTTNTVNFADRYNRTPHVDAVEPSLHLPHSKPPSRRSSRKNLFFNGELASEDTKKRSWDEASDLEQETIKRSRIEGEELIDGDETVDGRHSSQAHLPRGSKREFDSEDDENAYMRSNNRDKRPRNVSRDASQEIELMDEDSDEAVDHLPISRGKKRDRAEAGSTFGGDEDDEWQGEKGDRRRKRRSVPKRKSEVSSRGQKRDREGERESPGSDGERIDNQSSPKKSRPSKKKRGKKAMTEDSQSDVSMDGSNLSKDPARKDRKIGEEWEADGIQYKIGSNGEHLRLALVKKARNKYPMPRDSQHPDRSAHMEIYVETWMTEEQYKAAEDRQELVWQDSPRPSSEPQTPGDVPDSPSKPGKTLLWDLTKESPVPNRRLRQSVATSVGLRINPFQQSQTAPSGRRVTSSNMAPPSASPTRPGFRTFSKWEKQDLEAEAMARMRAKVQEQKKAASPLGKTPELATSATAPELGSKPPTVPIITLTPPSAPPSSLSSGKAESKPATVTENKTAPASFSFGAIPNPTKASQSSTQTTQSAAPSRSAAPSSASAFTPLSSAKPSTPFNLGNGQPPTTSTQSSTASLPSSSLFTQPVQQTSAAQLSAAQGSPAASTSSVPNFFAPKAPSAPSVSAFTAFWGANAEQKQRSEGQSTSTATANTTLPPGADSSKPAPFGFSKPSVLPSGNLAAQQSSKPNFFGAPTPATSAPPPETSNTAAPPKFDFGFKPKAPGPESIPKPSIPAGAGPSEPAKLAPTFSSVASPMTSQQGSLGVNSSPPKFNFGQPAATTTTSNPSSAPTFVKPEAEAPKFSFGQPSGSSTSASVNATASSSTSKPSFGFGNTSSGSVFGTASGSNETKTTGADVTRANSSAPKPATTAPVFGGTGFGASGSGFGKPNPLFGGQGSSSATNGSTFNFSGGQSVPSSPFSTTTPVGSPAQTNAFSFGAKSGEDSKSFTTSASAATTKPLFSFGKKDETAGGSGPASGEAKPSASSFAFGAPSASPFGQPSTSQNTAGAPAPSQPLFGKPPQPSPSTFGFGNTFSFGQPASQNQKQQQ